MNILFWILWAIGFLLDIFLWVGKVLTNSFGYATLDLSSGTIMFNILKNSFMDKTDRGFSISSAIGLKRFIKRKRSLVQGEQMSVQVRKVLEQKGQGLILMVRG